MCRFALFDDDREHDDLYERVKTLVGVQQRLHIDGIPSYLEGSRRGCHLWVFCDRLVPASQLWRWLLPSCPPGVEFFLNKMRARGGMAPWCVFPWACIAVPTAATGFSPGTLKHGCIWLPRRGVWLTH